MRKIIASINITIDGFCNHTAVIADDELHLQANELLKNADTMLLGRVTYQLMESGWSPIVKNPTGNKPMDEFALLIDNISKIVFSNTLHKTSWRNSTLLKGNVKEELLKLKQLPGKNIVVGGPSLTVTLMNLDLIDELKLCVQPIILGQGLT
jgi:dihydrofolate reductase